MSALDSMLDYVAHGLLPVMGISGRSFTADPPRSTGTRSRVLLVRIEGMPPLLLRAHASRRQACKNAEALRHLDALGLAAPRLVAHDLAGPSRLLRGDGGPVSVTVETWVEGTPHADLADSPEAADATLSVARLLARWHAVTRLRWGRPASARLWPFPSYTISGIRRMTRALAARGWLAEREARDLHARFGAWRPALGAIESFNLVHNDMNRRNIIVTAPGEVVPVDLHRLSYEPFQEELVNAVWHFCRKDRNLEGRFLETYFEHAGPASRAAWEALRGFFGPLTWLKKMYRRGAGPTPRDDPRMLDWKRQTLELSPPG